MTGLAVTVPAASAAAFVLALLSAVAGFGGLLLAHAPLAPLKRLLTGQVLLYGVALTPATLLGAWAGKKIVGRISDRVFVLLGL